MERSRRALLRLTAAGAMAAMAAMAGTAAAADTGEAVDISVQDATAKVGEPAFVFARIVPHAGFEIAANYRNRINDLSADQSAVEFGSKIVRGKVDGGALVFKVPVTPKRVGTNAINGVVRFAFVSETDGKRRLDIKWVPLIATVTGTQ